jgi:hypothetical protein
MRNIIPASVCCQGIAQRRNERCIAINVGQSFAACASNANLDAGIRPDISGNIIALNYNLTDAVGTGLSKAKRRKEEEKEKQERAQWGASRLRK